MEDSLELQRQIEKLRADEATLREYAQYERQLELEKAADEDRRRREEEARRRGVAQSEAQLQREDEEERLRQQQFWANFPQNCHTSCLDETLKKYSCCAHYLLRDVPDEWFFSLCCGCAYGKGNAYARIDTQYGMSRIAVTGEVVHPPLNFE